MVLVAGMLRSRERQREGENEGQGERELKRQDGGMSRVQGGDEETDDCEKCSRYSGLNLHPAFILDVTFVLMGVRVPRMHSHPLLLAHTATTSPQSRIRFSIL